MACLPCANGAAGCAGKSQPRRYDRHPNQSRFIGKSGTWQVKILLRMK